jgi:predicted amidohydrolase YtcJ
MMRTGSIFVAALLVASPASAQVNPCSWSRDLRLVNGRIHTLDARNSIVSEVTIQDGRFAYVGPLGNRKVTACTRTINLGGRTVVPGLIDNHNHIVALGLRPGYDTRLENAFSLGAVQETIRNRTKTLPAGSFITSLGGWNPRQFAEKRPPTMAELDLAAPDNPVLIYPSGGGAGGPAAGYVNTRAKALFEGKGVPVTTEGVVANGEPFAKGIAVLREAQTFEDEKRGTFDAMAYTAGLGLTTQVDQGFTIPRGTPDMKSSQVVDPGLSTFSPWTAYNAFLALHRENRMLNRLRIYWYTRDTEIGVPLIKERLLNNFPGLGDDMLRPAGVGESVVAGGLTQNLPANYEAALQVIARQGWSFSQHSTTLVDDKFTTAMFEKVNLTKPIADLRWSISHVPRIDLETLNRLKAIGAGVEVHAWTYLNGAPGSGPPYRLILDSGIRAGGGSDAANVTSINPWLMIYHMVTGKNSAGELVNAGQQITREEALRLYTVNNGWFLREEHKLGSIESGKLGDLVVLSGDYFDPGRVSDEAIRSLKSVLTVVDGKVVHNAMP